MRDLGHRRRERDLEHRKTHCPQHAHRQPHGGIVADEDSKSVKDTTVKLMKNGTDGTPFGSAVTTGEDGKFEFTAVPYGSYSLVAQKDSSTVTRQITIKTESTTENLSMSSGTKIIKLLIEDGAAALGEKQAVGVYLDATLVKTISWAVAASHWRR